MYTWTLRSSIDIRIFHEGFRIGGSESGPRFGDTMSTDSSTPSDRKPYIPTIYDKSSEYEKKPPLPDFSLTGAPGDTKFGSIAPSTQKLLQVGEKLAKFESKRDTIDYKISKHQLYTYQKISKDLSSDLNNAKNVRWESLSMEDKNKLADQFMEMYEREITLVLWNASINSFQRIAEFSRMRWDFFVSQQIYVASYSRDLTITNENLDQTTHKNIQKDIDTQEEEFDKIRQERLAIDADIQHTQEEYHMAQQELVTDASHQDTLNEIHTRESEDSVQKLYTDTHENNPWDPELLSHMSVWSVQSFDYWDDKWVTCTAVSGWDFVLQFPDCPSIYINANWDPKIAEREIAFFQEVAETPLVRRLLNMETGQFDLLRDRVQSKYDPTGKTRDNPQQFIKIMLEAILGVALAGKDQLWEWVNSIPRGIFSSPNIPLDIIQTAMRYASSAQKLMISYALAEQWVFDTVTRKFSPEIISRI